MKKLTLALSVICYALAIVCLFFIILGIVDKSAMKVITHLTFIFNFVSLLITGTTFMILSRHYR